jgi:hypothetical protein
VADAAKAIGYARRAGDRALAGLAFEEAAAHYERALGVLQPRGRDDELLRCDLLIATAEARRQASNPEYRETVGLAVELARRLGDAERLARAALGSARSGGFAANANVVDEALLALYEEASAALGTSDSLLRARVLGQLATELQYTPHRERRYALSREAVEMARRLGDRSGLAHVMILRLVAISDPFTLVERLALTAELAALAEELGSGELACNAANHRAGALLESGDIHGAECCVAEMERLAAQLRQPLYAWFAAIGRATLATTRGAADAEALALAAFEIGTAGGQPDAGNSFAAQLASIRWHQGRLDEVIDGVRAISANEDSSCRSIGLGQPRCLSSRRSAPTWRMRRQLLSCIRDCCRLQSRSDPSSFSSTVTAHCTSPLACSHRACGAGRKRSGISRARWR